MRIIAVLSLLMSAVAATAGPMNIATKAKASASSCAEGYDAAALNDGIARICGRGEWVSDVRETFWGEIDFPWCRLDWDTPVDIDKILIYDCMGSGGHTAGVRFTFEDGSRIDAGGVPADGSGYVSYANQPGLSSAHVFSHAGKPWLTQYWVRRVNEQAYGSISPYLGYGGHDEDQGQMSGVSALMSIGLFAIDGGSSANPCYEITSPVFDEVTIALDEEYYPGREFKIITHNNSAENCYIQSARLNGRTYNSFRLPNESFANGGVLELWLGDCPNKDWGLE